MECRGQGPGGKGTREAWTLPPEGEKQTGARSAPWTAPGHPGPCSSAFLTRLASSCRDGLPAPAPLPQGHNVPGQARSLHDIGQGDIVGPHVILPLAQAQDTAEHPARVQPHAHVQVHLSGLGHRPEMQTRAWAAALSSLPQGPKLKSWPPAVPATGPAGPQVSRSMGSPSLVSPAPSCGPRQVPQLLATGQVTLHRTWPGRAALEGGRGCCPACCDLAGALPPA